MGMVCVQPDKWLDGREIVWGFLSARMPSWHQTEVKWSTEVHDLLNINVFVNMSCLLAGSLLAGTVNAPEVSLLGSNPLQTGPPVGGSMNFSAFTYQTVASSIANDRAVRMLKIQAIKVRFLDLVYYVREYTAGILVAQCILFCHC